jgi:lysophospholipase L1-like esterase
MSHRAQVIYGNSSVPWKFAQHPTADLVVINLGTNDSNDQNGAVVVSDVEYTAAMIELIEKVHARYPKAQVIVMQIWQGFYQKGLSLTLA